MKKNNEEALEKTQKEKDLEKRIWEMAEQHYQSEKRSKILLAMAQQAYIDLYEKHNKILTKHNILSEE